MKRSELILEYIDGTLDGDAEQQLFEELARQPEFRSEMRQFIVIGEAVRADREAFLPPRDLENTLMAGLGLAPLPGSVISGAAPAVTAPAAAAATGLLAKLGVTKGLLPFLAAFVLGGLLVGGGVYIGMRDDSSSAVAGAGTTTTQALPSLHSDSAVEDVPGEVPAKVPAESESLPITSSSAASTVPPPTSATPSRRSAPASSREPWRSSSNGLGNSAIDGRRSGSNSPADPIPPTPIDTPPLSSTQAAPALIDNSRLRQGSEADRSAGDSLLHGPANAPTPPRPIVFPDEVEAARSPVVVVEARGIRTQLHNENQARVGGSVPLTESMAGGIHYRVDDAWQFGIEAGQERFYQTYHFSTDVGDGKRVIRIDQAPVLIWSGITGRFTTVPLVEGFTPFLQMTLGGAINHGPMARARVGMRYDVGNMFGLAAIAVTASAEGSALLYFYGNETMASTNAGGSFGVEVGL